MAAAFVAVICRRLKKTRFGGAVPNGFKVIGLDSTSFKHFLLASTRGKNGEAERRTTKAKRKNRVSAKRGFLTSSKRPGLASRYISKVGGRSPPPTVSFLRLGRAGIRSHDRGLRKQRTAGRLGSQRRHLNSSNHVGRPEELLSHHENEETKKDFFFLLAGSRGGVRQRLQTWTGLSPNRSREPKGPPLRLSVFLPKQFLVPARAIGRAAGSRVARFFLGHTKTGKNVPKQ
jgi:hypothetical protein